MKIILAGHEESKKILSASSWLLNKYVKGFDIKFLNFGAYEGNLATGKYITLDDFQENGVNSWSRYIREYLKDIKDKHIIFGLDDFFINKKAGDLLYLEDLLGIYNLCIESDLNNKNYSCTAQYTLWRKELLIEVLEQVKTPWDFEIEGSKYINNENIAVIYNPIFSYSGESALSSRHKGKVSVKGLKKSDVEILINKGYLKREELILGQPNGKVKSYD